MRAVLRLIWTYFAGTRLMRVFSALGLASYLTGMVLYSFVPPWTLGNGVRSDPLFLQLVEISAPWLGLLLLIASTALMPAIVERIALGRSIWVLPGGRLRLLASTLVPPALLALLAASVAAVFLPIPGVQERIFYRTALMSFVDFGLIYTGIWLVGKTSGIWRLAGMFWVLLSITIPVRYLGGAIPPFGWLERLGLAGWVVFGALLLSGGRIRHLLSGLREAATRWRARVEPATSYRDGRQISLMLGTSQPWIVALGQIVPIALMALLMPWIQVRLVVLMIFSAIAGAITSQAAVRSRRLWLRFDWTREQIFRQVEWDYWRYNLHSVAVLLVLFVVLAVYGKIPFTLLGHGVALLVLGCVASTYLGFTITRGLGWLESVLGILTMSALAVAGVALLKGDLARSFELELLLGGFAVVYRFMARARWLELDWMRCRPDVQARAAA
jgi:hypothetical protein